MIAHLPRAPRRHPTQRSESCGSTESLRLYARRVIQLEGGHSRTFTIVRSQPAIQSPVREARPPRAMVRIQPKRWSDHCQSAAHIKSAGVWSYQDSASPSSPLIGLCIAMHVPMVRISRGLPYVRLVSPACMDISPDDTRESSLSSVICNPRGPVCTQPREVGTFGSGNAQARLACQAVRLSPAPAAGHCSIIRHLPTPL